MGIRSFEFIKTTQHGRSFYLTKLPAKVLADVSYVAVRGESEEEGAVQRVLSARRISRIKTFTLAGGDYPTSIVLNWVNTTKPLKIVNRKLAIPVEPRSAQLIDGQHRVAGIREAIKEDSAIGSLELPVAIYDDLDTARCADIFLSINTEQKPVPKSLVFDLYSLSSEYLVDSAAVRAKDIAAFLNQESDSPYHQLIKFPGSPRRRSGIALSTVVSAIKPLVENKGVLDQLGMRDLDGQRRVILNFFRALQGKYRDEWESRDNAVIYASGFSGAIEFFRSNLVDYCRQRKSFKLEVISDALSLERSELIRQSEVRGMGGRAAIEHIRSRLVGSFLPQSESETAIAI